MSETTPAFPPDFLWGVATSAYQIEGSRQADGAGESVWDEFCRRPGAVEGGGDGSRACESYDNPERDLAHLTDLEVKAYRFSLGWSRIMPTGWGAPNATALDHHDRFVDRLLDLGITPLVTLNHWDMPQALMDLRGPFDTDVPGRQIGGAAPRPARGGWLARESVDGFAQYTEAVADRIGDRVSDWITQNEPWIIQLLGYQLGLHAPGIADLARSVVAGHHVLLGHGAAADILHARNPRARVGTALSLFQCYPATDTEADRVAAWGSDGYVNRWYLDPLYGKGYPAEMRAVWEAVLRRENAGFTLDDVIRPGDEDAIAGRSDFLGVNFYTRRVCAAVPTGADGLPLDDRDFPWQVVGPSGDVARTDEGWEIAPDTFRDLLVRLHTDYGAPRILITENGGVFGDTPTHDGQVHDNRRIAYLRSHLQAILDARAAGARIEGYMQWSLLDNFEWALGYRPRFGLVHVDYATGARTLKDSGRFYAGVARTGTIATVDPQYSPYG
ncbi:glycoside hydrolase family 1 protein [Xylanimonas protaetiae]|uniref:Glycosyl hydrolase family protein n=1 Tax=Xylanimonas protaetiae TaxID=2509457 RepID=A0A4P6F6M3_9MICO|nr:family 1 glycosylhydrolase [Xylanimonas protaetiae]QAY71650.1 glycosyl hydrolase family protein [Xylanimonas protaetiae]